jgi:hypothetical protein
MTTMRPSTRKERFRDLDAFSVVGLLWIVSALQVVWTLIHREAFGVASTLALAVTLSVPAAMAVRTFRRFIARTRHRGR